MTPIIASPILLSMLQPHMDWHSLLIWKRGIARGMRSARREGGWLAAFGALFGVLLILQLLLFGLLGVQTIQTLLTTRTDLRLEMKAQAKSSQVQDFYVHLQNQPYVQKSVFITKEQAYEHMREQDPELISFLEKFQMANPFPDTVGVTLTSLDDYGRLSEFVEQPRWRNVVDPTFLSQVTDQEKQVQEVLRTVQAGRSLTILILALTGGVLLFLLMELVRRRALDRADEVFIEQLTGAHPLSILLPFTTDSRALMEEVSWECWAMQWDNVHVPRCRWP